MSTNTQIHVTWRDYDIFGHETVPINRFLGPDGAKLLGNTLTRLPEIQNQLGDKTPLLDWQPVATEKHCYETTAEGVAVKLRLNDNLAHLTYSYQGRVYDGGRPTGLSKLQMTAIHRKLNQLVAVTIAQAVSNKVANYARIGVPIRQAQEIRQSITATAPNNLTLRVSACYK